MTMSIFAVRVYAFSLALAVVCPPPPAVALDQPNSPEDLVRRMAEDLRTCPSDERSDLLIEIEECGLGPDGKPLIPILLGMLGDKAPPHREATFSFFGPDPKLSDQELLERQAEPIVNLIATFGLEGVEPLRQALKNKDASTRAYAAYGLGQIGAPAEGSVPDLITMLREDDSDPKNMQRVVDIGAAIVPTLIEAVEAEFPADEQYNYNYMASEALGLIGTDAAPVPELRAGVLHAGSGGAECTAG